MDVTQMITFWLNIAAKYKNLETNDNNLPKHTKQIWRSIIGFWQFGKPWTHKDIQIEKMATMFSVGFI